MLTTVISIIAAIAVIAVVIWFVKSGLDKRTAKIAESQANSGLDKLEDPVKMTEQIIRDMSKKLEGGLEGQAKYKASIKRKEKDIVTLKERKKEWEDKANKIKAKVKSGAIKVEDATDGLTTCLNTIENLGITIDKEEKVLVVQNTKYGEFSTRVTRLKETIHEANENLRQLKADSELAKVNKEFGKEFANIDGVNNASSQMARLREKVDADMALGDAYAELENDNKTAEDKVNDLLEAESPTENSKLVEDFLKS